MPHTLSFRQAAEREILQWKAVALNLKQYSLLGILADKIIGLEKLAFILNRASGSILQDHRLCLRLVNANHEKPSIEIYRIGSAVVD